MLKLLKNMRRKEALMALICLVFVVGQIYFDLRLPDYMTELTMLIKTSGQTADILNVGLKMLGCTAASALLAVVCGYLSARTASGFSFVVREKVFHHVMDIGQEEMSDFSVPSLITRTTNDITQIQMIVAMGLQMMIKAPIMAVWGVIKILGKSWELSVVTAGFVVAICLTVFLVMATCIPRFRIVQKLTDSINRVARENLTGINVVHAFNAEKYQNDKFEGHDERPDEEPEALRAGTAHHDPGHERAGTGHLLAGCGAGESDSADGPHEPFDYVQQRAGIQHLCHLYYHVLHDAGDDLHDAAAGGSFRRAHQRSAGSEGFHYRE